MGLRSRVFVIYIMQKRRLHMNLSRLFQTLHPKCEGLGSFETLCLVVELGTWSAKPERAMRADLEVKVPRLLLLSVILSSPCGNSGNT